MKERLVNGLALREWGDPGDPAILLWPGLGATSAYFAGVGQSLPGRAIAVDPPGFGRSPSLDRYTRESIVEMASDVLDACDCRAIVGHSLGAYIAAELAGRPNTSLCAAVLIDGGFLDVATMTSLGMPVAAGREQLLNWFRENELHFADWDTAVRELATMIGMEPTSTLEAYLREILVEVEGEIRGRGPLDRSADLVLAIVNQEVLTCAERVRVPTLLITCGQGPNRPIREEAWRKFTDSSALIELHVADEWGHNPILQDPKGSSQLIADWFKRYI